MSKDKEIKESKTEAPQSVSPQEEKSREALSSVKDSADEMRLFYDTLASADNPALYKKEVGERLGTLKRTSKNLLKAYRDTVTASDELSARWKDITRSKKKKKLIPAPPANAEIDIAERRTDHFAQGMNLYKILLICFIGSFIGVIIEMLYCLVQNGYIESRAGLIYGPFNLLYGLGAVALTASLYRFRNHSKWLSFMGGFVIGSAVEYACSWVQELAFGSRSWDYSGHAFNINGRICLLYSVFWGILGVLWMKDIYPWMAKLILKIPDRVGKIMTWVLVAFFAVNAVVTVIAVFRWSQRIDLIAPSNAFWSFIDSRFTNERMEFVFANMVFGTK